MIHFVKVTLKNGQILDIKSEYQEFVSVWKEATESKDVVVFSDDLHTFKYSDVELVQSATQEEDKTEISVAQMDENLVRMEKDLEKFRAFRATLTGETVLITDLMAAMEKPDFSEIANEPVETGAPEAFPEPEAKSE